MTGVAAIIGYVTATKEKRLDCLGILTNSLFPTLLFQPTAVARRVTALLEPFNSCTPGVSYRLISIELGPIILQT